jgi:hypothetical protein
MTQIRKTVIKAYLTGENTKYNVFCKNNGYLFHYDATQKQSN